MAVVALQTRALVLRSRALRESDRLVDLFTREYGLVQAIAKSARETRSKLRFALEPYSLIEVTLVRGRELWRVRGASSEESLYRALRGDEKKRSLLARIASLTARLVAGEEKNAALFDHLQEALSFLPGVELSFEELKAFEGIVVLRILSELGYKLPRPGWQRFISEPLSAELCRDFLPLKTEAVELINQTLAQTQL